MKHTPNITILMLLLCITIYSSQALAGSNKGEELYAVLSCKACHGTKGSRGIPSAIAKNKISYDQYHEKIRAENSPTMPYYSPESLDDQKAKEIFAYLHE
ncbi:MAG: cytochrome c [Desulfotalea sp.]